MNNKSAGFDTEHQVDYVMQENKSADAGEMESSVNAITLNILQEVVISTISNEV